MRFPAGLRAMTGLCCLLLHYTAGAAPAAAVVAGGATLEHGIARMQVAVSGEMLELRLRAPLHTLLGFETAPRNQKQRQAVRRMAAQLRQPLLFVPTLEAQCRPAGVVLASEAIAAADFEPEAAVASEAPVSRAGRQPASPTYPDLSALFTYECGNARLLTGLQVRMFEAFPALRQIDVEIATPRGESGARLSPNRAGLTW